MISCFSPKLKIWTRQGKVINRRKMVENRNRMGGSDRIKGTWEKKMLECRYMSEYEEWMICVIPEENFAVP